ncbi:Retrovirus-related Pol polyprotein from type-1 retrotransposable element R1 3 [Eumeta japonica]|uniref:Retrovirus-related Pol polyprotein from type-1 retrotransposable element R1 3 n=1 Tax=Eumeta variegata TaxID=151549 RepID=A0A4C1XD87_EUMVA|nr:Retrovirus-related Pol polyprotein from type-1 retrotransposable element R1 3 [Eumeta japonica]
MVWMRGRRAVGNERGGGREHCSLLCSPHWTVFAAKSAGEVNIQFRLDNSERSWGIMRRSSRRIKLHVPVGRGWNTSAASRSSPATREQGHVSGPVDYSVFCDLPKTFDCVYHETDRETTYGIAGRALDLLKSYLSNVTKFKVLMSVAINISATHAPPRADPPRTRFGPKSDYPNGDIYLRALPTAAIVSFAMKLSFVDRFAESVDESVEDMDSQTLDRLAVVGSHIYTNGSRIEGKVGAALTEWRDGQETWFSTLRLDPFCTVFQAEMVALQRAIRRVKKGKDGLVNDSVTPDQLWRRAHQARRSHQKDCSDYDKLSLSYAKKVMRTASLEEWQKRYAERSRGEITKCFFRRVEQAYRVLQKIEMTSQMAQTLTGYGGFAQYLHRFKLMDSPHCACDPAKIQDVLHVLEECPMFLREHVALEAEIGVIVGRRNFSTIMDHDKIREKFIGFLIWCSKDIQN